MLRLAPQPRGRGADRVTALGDLDRGGEARVEPAPSVALRELDPARDRPGHRHRPRAVLGHRRDRVDRRRGGSRRVERAELAVPPHQREEVAADAGRHRLGDAQDGGSGQGGVGGVAALREHAQCRGGGERLARGRHRARGDGGRARALFAGACSHRRIQATARRRPTSSGTGASGWSARRRRDRRRSPAAPRRARASYFGSLRVGVERGSTGASRAACASSRSLPLMRTSACSRTGSELTA
jgi:hypothetical protein